MPKPKELPPNLIKLSGLKRKEADQGTKWKEKKLKKDSLPIKHTTNDSDVTDNSNTKESESTTISGNITNSDCNQNYITKDDQSINRVISPPISQNPNLTLSNNPIPSTPNNVVTSQIRNNIIEINDSPVTNKQCTLPPARIPLIEDISSDEEPLEPFRLRNTYDTKINGNPKRILESSEVSHCTLIDGNVELIENAVQQRFPEKPLVYTKPVTPQIQRNAERPVNHIRGHVYSTQQLRPNSEERSYLSNTARFEEDQTSLMCHLRVRDTSELAYSPTKNMEEGFPTQFVEEPTYLNTSPGNSPRFPPNITPPIGGTPISPVIPGRRVLSSTSPVVPDTSGENRKSLVSDERQKRFNFARCVSTDSVNSAGSVGGRCANFPTDSNDYYEIKTDGKLCRIRKRPYEKIPKGKLYYNRKINTLIRYFDDKQIELFIRSLNEGSHVASDLLKQFKDRADGLADIDTSAGHPGKSEVITLPKDVYFSTEDFLSDPELYVEEAEKVEKYAPEDFYGFYKFVTGYQIVRHNTPISFQTFLLMHNTSGLRDLFKSYVSSLIEDTNILPKT